MNSICLIIGLFKFLLMTYAQQCPDPVQLKPEAFNTPTIVTTSTTYETIDIYQCSINRTRVIYECKESRKGNILLTENVTKLKKKYIKDDKIIFVFEGSDEVNEIKLHEGYKEYVGNKKGNELYKNNTSAGIDDKVEVFYTTITLKKKQVKKLSGSLFGKFMNNCSYTAGYCYDDINDMHSFWKTSNNESRIAKMLYIYDVFFDAYNYTMSQTPLIQFVLLKRNNTFLALQLLKKMSDPYTYLTYWQTDYGINVSFHYSKAVLFPERRLISLRSTKASAFKEMSRKCILQLRVLDQNLETHSDALVDVKYLWILIIHVVSHTTYSIFNITLNYFTLRKLDYGRTKRWKVVLYSVSQAMTRRYIVKKLHGEHDDLHMKLEIIRNKMYGSINRMENFIYAYQLSKERTVNYDYVCQTRPGAEYDPQNTEGNKIQPRPKLPLDGPTCIT